MNLLLLALPKMLNRILQGPALNPYGLVKTCVLKAFRLGNFAQAHTLTVPNEKQGVGSVLHLFTGAGPATVSWLIVPVNIDSIKRMTIWARPHICKECLKTFSPSVAHDNSSPSVLRKLFMIGPMAAAFGTYPGIVLARPRPSFSEAMGNRGTQALLPPVAAATKLSANDKIMGDNRAGCAAIAFAYPSNFIANASRLFFNYQAPKALANKVW